MIIVDLTDPNFLIDGLNSFNPEGPVLAKDSSHTRDFIIIMLSS